MSLSDKMTIEEVDFTGKRVLIRVDFNVPIRDGVIVDPKRIVAVIPTLNYILAHKPQSIVIMSHRGRPNGQVKEKLSMKHIIPKLEELLGKKVMFLNNCVGPEVEAACANPKPGSIILLENLRFHIEETGKAKTKEGKKIKADKKKVIAFRASLSKLGNIYVNDAFGTAHRAHSSMVGVNLPIRCPGFLMGRELKAFARVKSKPARPFLAVLGGAKVADKIPLLMNLMNEVDEMIITGAMAFTFLKVMNGMEIGNSRFEKSAVDLVPKIMAKAKARGVKLHLPKDFTIGNKFSKDADSKTVTVEEGIPEGWMGLDVGPLTRMHDSKVIWRSKTIVMNGTVGVFEIPQFAFGQIVYLNAVAAATVLGGALTIIGGGDSASSAKIYKVDGVVSHVSTGGGASLELLEGKALPGIVALSDSHNLKSNL